MRLSAILSPAPTVPASFCERAVCPALCFRLCAPCRGAAPSLSSSNRARGAGSLRACTTRAGGGTGRLLLQPPHPTPLTPQPHVRLQMPLEPGLCRRRMLRSASGAAAVRRSGTCGGTGRGCDRRPLRSRTTRQRRSRNTKGWTDCLHAADLAHSSEQQQRPTQHTRKGRERARVSSR